ncbi:hypothetical protein E4U41_007469 [Claviceps citrina]|nr:hypothetical protein E4U41_007469 [Claviceps citrina]
MPARYSTTSDFEIEDSPILAQFQAFKDEYAVGMMNLSAIASVVPPGSIIDLIFWSFRGTWWEANIRGPPDTHYARRIRPYLPFVLKQRLKYEGYTGQPDEMPAELYKRFFLGLMLAARHWQIMVPMQCFAMENFIMERLAKMVWASNMMANAGAGWTVTWEICRKVFQGSQVEDTDGGIAVPDSPDPFDTGDGFEEHWDVEDEPVLESSSWRDRHDGRGVRPYRISSCMNLLLSNGVIDLSNAVERRSFDPFQFVARFIFVFASIRPFAEGNGRMCRLLLTALLLRFTTTLASLGTDPREFEQIGRLLAPQLMLPAVTSEQHIQQLAMLLLKQANGYLDKLDALLVCTGMLGYAPLWL